MCHGHISGEAGNPPWHAAPAARPRLPIQGGEAEHDVVAAGKDGEEVGPAPGQQGEPVLDENTSKRKQIVYLPG